MRIRSRQGRFTSAGGVSANNTAKWQGCAGCYPDCDTQTGPGILDIFDFPCFGNAFSKGCP